MTMEIGLWTFAAVVLSIFMLPFISVKTASLEVNPWLLAAMMIIIILGSAAAIILVMTKWKVMNPIFKKALAGIGICIYGFAVGNGLLQALQGLRIISNIGDVRAVAIEVAGILTALLMVYLIHKKFKLPVVLRINNVLMVCLLSYAGAEFATKLSLFTAMTLLCAVAVYDAIAVWKLGTMQQMAQGLAESGIIPGIGIPHIDKKGKPQARLLGGGDVLFICMLTCVLLLKAPQAVAIGGFLGMFLGLMGLLFGAKKDVAYPAIPFILAGLVVGLGIGVLTGMVF